VNQAGLLQTIKTREIGRIMICNLCSSVKQNVRSNKRHERLQQIGLTERISHAIRAKAIWVTRHRCEICEAEWRHVDDANDPCAGWSLERTPQLCE
jgi:hypothetical protein